MQHVFLFFPFNYYVKSLKEQLWYCTLCGKYGKWTVKSRRRVHHFIQHCIWIPTRVTNTILFHTCYHIKRYQQEQHGRNWLGGPMTDADTLFQRISKTCIRMNILIRFGQLHFPTIVHTPQTKKFRLLL